MNIGRIAVVVVGVAMTLGLAGCKHGGACMLRPSTGHEKEGESCFETTKSVCDEGRDRWVDGKCGDDQGDEEVAA